MQKTGGRVKKRLTWKLRRIRAYRERVIVTEVVPGQNQRKETSGELIKMDIDIKQDQSKYRITVSEHGK